MGDATCDSGTTCVSYTPPLGSLGKQDETFLILKSN